MLLIGHSPKRKPDYSRMTGTMAVAARAMLEEGVYYRTSSKRRPVMRTHEEETAVPFAPGKNSHSGNPDQLDRAGIRNLNAL